MWNKRKGLWCDWSLLGKEWRDGCLACCALLCCLTGWMREGWAELECFPSMWSKGSGLQGDWSWEGSRKKEEGKGSGQVSRAFCTAAWQVEWWKDGRSSCISLCICLRCCCWLCDFIWALLTRGAWTENSLCTPEWLRLEFSHEGQTTALDLGVDLHSLS